MKNFFFLKKKSNMTMLIGHDGVNVFISMLDQEMSMPEFLITNNKRERNEETQQFHEQKLFIKKTKTRDVEEEHGVSELTRALFSVPASVIHVLKIAEFVKQFRSFSGNWRNNAVIVDNRHTPNKKYSPKQYAAFFSEWAENVAQYLGDQKERTFVLTANVAMKGNNRLSNQTIHPLILDETKHSLSLDGTTHGNVVPNTNHILVPGDSRCMGCRRFFVTLDASKTKPLGFYLCNCARQCRAAYCLRCRAIYWALHVTAESDMVDCVSGLCNVKWGLQDLIVLSVQRRAP